MKVESNQDLVSVILSVYNEKIEWIKLSVESILNQTYTNLELIIILDNPKNKIITNYLNEISSKDIRIKLLVNHKNIGLAESLNRGLAISKGDFIARMDADDIAYLNRLSLQVVFLKKNQNIDLLSSSVDYIDENGKKIGRSNQDMYTPKQIEKILPKFNMLIHPTFLMRRKVYEKTLGYRNFTTSEDYDFVLRVLDMGFKIIHITDRTLMYRRRTNSMSLGNALVTQLNTEYIQSLHKQRVKNKGFDTYNFETMLSTSYIKNEKENKKYVSIMNEYYQLGKNRNKIQRLIIIFKGLKYSKYFRKYFPLMTRNKILNKFHKYI